MNQKVINFVNKLKNASLVNHKIVTFPYSDLILEYTDCLYREGFIQSYQVTFEDEKQKKIKVITRSYNGKTLTSNLKLVSTLTKKRYITSETICLLNLKKVELFLSTSDGILSLNECKKQKVGGIVVFAC